MGDFSKLIKNTLNHHNLADYTSLSEKTTILAPAIFFINKNRCNIQIVMRSRDYFEHAMTIQFPFHMQTSVPIVSSIFNWGRRMFDSEVINCQCDVSLFSYIYIRSGVSATNVILG